MSNPRTKSDSECSDEEFPPLTMRRSQKKQPKSGHSRTAAVDFGKKFVSEVDRATTTEDPSVLQRVKFGTPYPIIHQKVKAAAQKAGPKDADADWDLVDKEEWCVKNNDDTRGGEAVDKESENGYVLVARGKLQKTKTYTSNLANATCK